MDHKVIVGQCRIYDEPTGGWRDEPKAWQVYGDTRLKKKFLKTIPGAVEDRWERWNVPVEQMTPQRRSAITELIFAEPRPDLVFTIHREEQYIRATCQRESEITLIVHPDCFVISGKLLINRVWYSVGAEFSQVGNGDSYSRWEYQDRYTRPEMTTAARLQIKQELGVIVASYLARYDTTLKDAERKRLKREISTRENKLLELTRQMNALHDEIHDLEYVLVQLDS